MRISVTDLQTYKRCRRMWGYSSQLQRNLTRVGLGSSALELGGLIHRALAAWILNPNDVLPLLFLQEATKRKKEIEDRYREVVGGQISEVELEPFLDLLILGKEMMTNYQTYHKTPVPANMSFAAAEQEIEVPVPGTEHQCPNCDGSGYSGFELTTACRDCNRTGITSHYLTGTLDGLLQDTKIYLYVLEHKTYHVSYAPSETSLNMNQQFTRYAWIVRQAGLGRVAGILYDGMAKRSKPARGKDLDSLFIRYPILKSDDELDCEGENIRQEIMEIASGAPLYPNVPWQGCQDCSFTDVCMMQSRGEDYESYLRDRFTQRETIRVSGVRDD